jgi:hypothetical protein
MSFHSISEVFRTADIQQNAVAIINEVNDRVLTRERVYPEWVWGKRASILDVIYPRLSVPRFGSKMGEMFSTETIGPVQFKVFVSHYL